MDVESLIRGQPGLHSETPKREKEGREKEERKRGKSDDKRKREGKRERR